MNISFSSYNYRTSALFNLSKNITKTACHFRYDLDACDIREKYPENFQVTLNVEVSSKEGFHDTDDLPWEDFSAKGINPKILFSSKEEQQEILLKFGGFSCNFELNLHAVSFGYTYLRLQ